ncbi:sirohydrochlorin chelatase [Psychrilyobacter atlanticus]|uniref:sirohydrochlorin chelatase n=1 Tax=Psychrilyobacter atlanticus TaxID=271091 RepID=UPI000415717D|nr:CbiX/SirB N-terminal domain-containing protein [Psychrilyobacter atlanticus]
MRGILVVGHGSKVLEVNEKFKELIKILRKNTGEDVRGANLTLADPRLEEVIRSMYSEGFREITVIPYFLSNGSHVTEHIPRILKELESDLENLSFLLESSLLLNSLVIKAVEEKINNS